MENPAVTAAEVVAKVMAENKEKHGDAWKTISIYEHCEHASDHCNNCLDFLEYPIAVLEEMEHALCRLAMALTLAKEMQNAVHKHEQPPTP